MSMVIQTVYIIGFHQIKWCIADNISNVHILQTFFCCLIYFSCSNLCRFDVSKQDGLKLSTLKTDTFGNNTDIKSKKRKFKGGPNPLSCKKKKKPTVESKNQPEAINKKHRKRKRVKLATHVKEVLINKAS